MRFTKQVLLVLLLVALFTVRTGDPTRHAEEPPPPGTFPFLVGTGPVPGHPAGSVLLVPLDGGIDTIRLTSPEEGVDFDVNGDGRLEHVAWTEPRAPVAFLALDVDGDGRISSGREIFGSGMRPNVHNGCNALLEAVKGTEASAGGSLHAGHRLYEELLLWTDRNHDGRSQPEELRRARERFTEVGLGFSPRSWRDEHGNRVRFEGWLQARTGGPEQMSAMDPAEARVRLRHYYEVLLVRR